MEPNIGPLPPKVGLELIPLIPLKNGLQVDVHLRKSPKSSIRDAPRNAGNMLAH